MEIWILNTALALLSLPGVVMAVIEASLPGHSIQPDGQLWREAGGKRRFLPWPLSWLQTVAIEHAQGWNNWDLPVKVVSSGGIVGIIILNGVTRS